MKMPWVVVSILFLIWSYGIYEGYFGDYVDEPLSDALELSLVNFDRTLRLEDSLAGKPRVLRWLMYCDSPREGMAQVRDGLVYLDSEGQLDKEAEWVLGLIRSELGEEVDPETMPDGLFKEVIAGRAPEAAKVWALAAKVSSHDGRWWDAVIARRILEKGGATDALRAALVVQDELDDKLLMRSIVSSGIFWAIGLLGLFFVPHAYRRMLEGWKNASTFRPVRYHSRWEPSLIFAVFLGADLIGDEFVSGAYFVAEPWDTGFYFDVLLDTIWRLIPPVLAAAILFAKPRHAIRAFGMNRRPEWRIVLAVFGVLMGLDYFLYQVMKPFIAVDPVGNLDSMEIGWRGLFYGLLSACVAAPVAEEMFYRGLLLRGLEKRFGFVVAAVCVTGSFALVHYYDLYGFISVAIFGFSALAVYRATGSLITSIVLHSLYNLSITLPMWLVYHSRL